MRDYRPLVALIACAICATTVRAQIEYRQPGYGYQPLTSNGSRAVYARPGDPSAVPPGFYQPSNQGVIPTHAAPTDAAPINAAPFAPPAIVASGWNRRSSSGQPRASQPTAQQTPHPAVVRVSAAERGATSLGSGTLIDVNDQFGLVITNWHVVRDATAGIKIAFPDGFQSVGQVLRTDSEWDLAAVLINKPNVAPVKVAGDAPRIGELLTIAGYGSGAYRMASGQCLQYLAPGTNHPFEIVELAAAARQGDSGGPIFNNRGELAGVLFGEGEGRTSGSYCGRVHRFLSSASSDVSAVQRSIAQLQVANSRATGAAANSVNSIAAQPGLGPDRASRGWQPRMQNVASREAPARGDNSSRQVVPSTVATMMNAATINAANTLAAVQPQAPLVPIAANGNSSANNSKIAASDDSGRYWQPEPSAGATASTARVPMNNEGASGYGSAATSANKSQPGSRDGDSNALPLAAVTRPAMATAPATNAFPQPSMVPRPTMPQQSAPAALNPSVDTPLAATMIEDSSSSSDDPPVPASASDDWTWQVLAGDTLIAQVKTVLSAVGVLAILFHAGRLASRPAAKPAKKKSKAG